MKVEGLGAGDVPTEVKSFAREARKVFEVTEPKKLSATPRLSDRTRRIKFEGFRQASFIATALLSLEG